MIAATSGRLVWTGMLFAVIAFCAAPAGGQNAPDDEDAGDDAAQEKKVVNIVPPAFISTETGEQAFEGVVFGARGENAAGARAWLDALLLRKIASVDRLSRLTEPQKRKLHLAGRGDIKRFFDRVEEQRRQILLLDDELLDRKTVDEMVRATRLLRHVLDLGPFEEGSLFVKAVRRMLTAEQIGRAEALREIARAGGQVETQREGADECHQVELSSTDFADNGLKQIRNLKGLKVLALDETHVTDSGLAHLAGLANLEVLDLSRTEITDSGLAHLKGMTSLRIICLKKTRVTDAGLEHLTGLKNLEVVDLARTQITNAGLAHLKGLKQLKRLDLSGIRATDAGLDYLSGLTSLERLFLSDTHVTDAGLVHLYELTKLQRLDLFGATVSEPAVEAFLQSVPGVKVFR